MIRNVVVGHLRADVTPEDIHRLEAGLAGIAGLRLPGQVGVHVGRDAGLRPGNWSFAITSDWVDAAAYRAYDVDAEHAAFRAMIAEVCTEVARVQVEIPG